MTEVLSPYERALGDRLHDLHPVLQTYFRTIPIGYAGVGSGTFTFAGTKRAFLRPLFRFLEPSGVLFAGAAHDVPFTVRNVPAGGTIAAVREMTVGFERWAMRDRVSFARAGRIVDTLGVPARVAAVFRVEVVDGALVMVSERVGLRWGRLRVRLPRFVSPRVRLVERFDDTVGRQHVAATMTLPLLGDIYGYHGHFDYEIVEAA